MCLIGVNNTNMNSSEYVRQELRARVSSRTQQMGGVPPPQSPIGPGSMLGNTTNTTMALGTPQQSQMSSSMINTTPDPTMGFNFDMQPSGKYER